MYRCVNPSCRLRDNVLTGEHVYADKNNHLHCSACGQFVRHASKQSDEAAKGVAGLAGGALLGWAVGGPAGALIGAILGGIAGAASGSAGGE